MAFYEDRDGNVYKTIIPVDEEIEFVPGSSIKDDQAIQAAVEWLKDQ